MSDPLVEHKRSFTRFERWESITDLPLLLVTIFSVGLLVRDHDGYKLLQGLVTFIFALDLAIRLVLYGPNRKVYARRVWYDFAIVGLSIIQVFAALRMLRSVRVLRVLRFLRILALLKRVYSLGKRVWSQLHGRSFIVGSTVLLGLSTLAVWLFEKREGETDLQNLSETVWWALNTMSTVGSENSPGSVGGNISAAVLILSGITIFGIVTGNLAAAFTESHEKELETQIAELTSAVEKLAAQLNPPAET